MISSGTDRPAGSLRAAGRLLLAEPDRLLVPAVALTVLGLVLNVLLQWVVGSTVAGSTPCERDYLSGTLVARCAAGNGRAQLGVLIGLFLVFLIGHLVAAGLSRASLDLVDGVPGGGVFGGGSVTSALPAAVVLSLGLTIGTVFLVLPGLVAAFLSRYAMTFVVDQGLGVLAAVKASVDLVTSDLLGEVGFALRSLLVLLGGLLLLGVGLLAAVPLVLLAQTLRYRAHADRGAVASLR